MKNQHIFRFNSRTVALSQSLVRKTASIFSLLICIGTAAFGQVGTFDAGFGSAGAYTFPIPQGADFVSGNNLIVLPNDQILVQTAEKYDQFEPLAKGKLNRLTTGGMIDASFGTGGATLIQDSIFSHSLDFLVMPNGKIASLACSARQTTSASDKPPFITMYNTDGSVDANFGINGRVLLPATPHGRFTLAKIITDGSNFYILYEDDNAGQVIRSYTSTGAVNGAFGNSGVISFTSMEYARIIYTPIMGGRLLLVDALQIKIKRLLLSGLTDFSYGNSGTATAPNVNSSSFCGFVGLQSDGSLLVPVSDYGAGRFNTRIVRVDASGVVDAAFGNNAQISQAVNGSLFIAADLVQQPDGKILLAGYNIDTATENSQKAFFRLNGDGTADNSFGVNGLLSLGAFDGEGLVIVGLQSTGKIIALVEVDINGNSTAAYVIRLLNNLNVGVLQNSKLTELGLYPNPIVSQFELSYELGSSAAISINLVDAQGRTVHSFQTQQKEDGKQVHSFSLPSTVAAGFYTVVIQSDNGNSNNLQILVKR